MLKFVSLAIDFSISMDYNDCAKAKQFGSDILLVNQKTKGELL